jgi:Protein of unknown function (DUF935)
MSDRFPGPSDVDVLEFARSSGLESLPRPRAEFEVGVSYNLPFVTPYKQAWELYREDPVTVQQLVAMRQSDGQARALYRLMTLPIRSALAKATFVPETGVTGGEEEATFAEQMLTLPPSSGGMKTPLARVVAQILTALFDGFSALEMVYWIPKVGPLKGKWTLEKLAYRPSDTLTFLVDERGDFSGFRQQATFKGQAIDVELAKDHMVYYAAQEEERPFYGVSYFQSAFYHWDRKLKLYYIAHLAAQRAAVGTRIGKMAPGASKVEEANFKKALADLGMAQWITMPENWSVDVLREAGTFDFLALINHHDSQMSKSILASFFDKDQGGGQGDAKLVDFGTQSDALFMLMLETIMGEVESVINEQVLPRFIDWNFGSSKYPKFKFGPLSEEQRRAIRDTFDKLAVAGQSLTASHEFVLELEKRLAEEFGLEIDYEAIEADLEKAKELERRQAEAFLPPPGAPGGAAQPAQGGPDAPAGPPVPEGFQLSAAPALELSEMARELLSGEVGLSGVPRAPTLTKPLPGSPAALPKGVAKAYAAPGGQGGSLAALLVYEDGSVALRDESGTVGAKATSHSLAAFKDVGWSIPEADIRADAARRATAEFQNQVKERAKAERQARVDSGDVTPLIEEAPSVSAHGVLFDSLPDGVAGVLDRPQGHDVNQPSALLVYEDGSVGTYDPKAGPGTRQPKAVLEAYRNLGWAESQEYQTWSAARRASEAAKAKEAQAQGTKKDGDSKSGEKSTGETSSSSGTPSASSGAEGSGA